MKWRSRDYSATFDPSTVRISPSGQLQPVDSSQSIREERIISNFLFMPRTIAGETRWLERVFIMQRYISCVWIDIQWLEYSDMLTFEKPPRCNKKDKDGVCCRKY